MYVFVPVYAVFFWTKLKVDEDAEIEMKKFR